MYETAVKVPYSGSASNAVTQAPPLPLTDRIFSGLSEATKFLHEAIGTQDMTLSRLFSLGCGSGAEPMPEFANQEDRVAFDIARLIDLSRIVMNNAQNLNSRL